MLCRTGLRGGHHCRLPSPETEGQLRYARERNWAPGRRLAFERISARIVPVPCASAENPTCQPQPATLRLDRPRSAEQRERFHHLVLEFYSGLVDERREFTYPMESLLACADFMQFEMRGNMPVAMGGLVDGYREIVYTVIQGAQGRGLGHKLLSDLVAVASSKGCSYLRGTIYRTNQVSLHLHCDKMGYHRVGHVVVDGRDAELIVLPLRIAGYVYLAGARLLLPWTRVRRRVINALRH